MTFLLAAFGFLRNSWIGKVLAIAAAGAVAVLLVFSAGGRAQRRKQKITNLEGYIDVQKRVDRTAEEAARAVGAMSDDELNERLSRHPGALRK